MSDEELLEKVREHKKECDKSMVEIMAEELGIDSEKTDKLTHKILMYAKEEGQKMGLDNIGILLSLGDLGLSATCVATNSDVQLVVIDEGSP